MIQLRDYQQRAVDQVRSELLAGRTAVCLVSPTGSGKTKTGTYMATEHVKRSPKNRVAIYVHREELLGQWRDEIAKQGVEVRTLQGAGTGPATAPVTVAMVQTVASRGDVPPASLVVVDECHHTAASTWSSIVANYHSSLILGLTATPVRADGKPLQFQCGDRTVFDSLVEVTTVGELTKLGHLVPCRIWAPQEPSKTLAEDPVEVYRKHGNGRKCVVFACSVQHAEQLTADFHDAGISAVNVDGEMTSTARRDRLAMFKAGKVRVLINVMILTEGWDDPTAEMLILCRQPDHVGTWLQMIGRVIRPAPGKSICDVWDLRGAVWLHLPPEAERTWSLDGEACRLGAKTSDSVTVCRGCSLTYASTQPECPHCGLKRPPRPDPAVVKARIEQFVAREDRHDVIAYQERLRLIAQQRGYAPKWVHYRMQAKYGPGYRERMV